MTAHRRTGLVPDLRTQLVVDLVSASIAHRRARAQAALGVHPRIAEVNGYAAANYLIGYFVFIFPVAAFSALCALSSPFAMLGFGPLALVGALIGVRFRTWWGTRGDRRNVYSVPTGALIAFGPIWMVSMLVLDFVLAMNGTLSTY